MTALPATQNEAANLPTTPFSEPWLSTLRKGLGTVEGRPCLMTGFSISEAEKRRLRAMIAQLQARVSPPPGNSRLLAVSLAKLFAAFPAQAQSDAPVEQRMEAYFEALHGVPAWAVEEARYAIVRGEAVGLNDTWAPTPPQLAKIAKERMKTVQADLNDLILIEQAKPIDVAVSEAERERVNVGFDKLKMEL